MAANAGVEPFASDVAEEIIRRERLATAPHLRLGRSDVKHRYLLARAANRRLFDRFAFVTPFRFSLGDVIGTDHSPFRQRCSVTYRARSCAEAQE